nr:hypothetical protein Iba_chr01fCG3510 [Ipomoea batatas]
MDDCDIPLVTMGTHRDLGVSKIFCSLLFVCSPEQDKKSVAFELFEDSHHGRWKDNECGIAGAMISWLTDSILPKHAA